MMTTSVPRIGLALAALAAGIIFIAPRAASAGPGREDPMNQFVYTAPPNILRAQRALERLGGLERGKYSPGEYDQPTQRAIRKFQWDHTLHVTGWLDRDTFAMLPTDDRPDRDDDGVPDAEDRCPDTPKQTAKGAWVRVGQDGCLIAKNEKK
jgi:hypothetical protein